MERADPVARRGLSPSSDSNRPGWSPPRSAPRSWLPPLILGADHDPIVLHPLGLQLEPRQRADVDLLHAEPKPLVGLSQSGREPREDPLGLRIVRGNARKLDEDLDLISDPLRGVQMDLELVDLRDLPDDRLDGPRVHVRSPHELHVVDAAPDPSVVDVERPAALTPVV